MSQQTSPSTHLEWDLADRLRKALRTADIGVQEMAEHLEVSRNSVGNYINGRTTPSASTLRVWALRCGVPYGWLRDGLVPSPNPDDHGSGVTNQYTANNVVSLPARPAQLAAAS